MKKIPGDWEPYDSTNTEHNDPLKFEVVEFSNEVVSIDGGRPNSVECADITSDANRRDFTINTGYINIRTGELLDPTEHFVDDILSKTLKFVGKASDRLDEDPTRAMRFYRFMNRGFAPDKRSLQAVRERIQNDSKKVKELQSVLKLPGVEQAIEDALESQRKDDKMVSRVKTVKTVTMNAGELSKTLLNLERIRLEIEKMVGV